MPTESPPRHIRSSDRATGTVCFAQPMGPKPNAPARLHTHETHEFYFCHAGGGHQYTDAGRQTMRTGDLYLFPAGMRHIGVGLPHGRSVGIVLNVADDALSDPGEGGDEPRRIFTAACDLARGNAGLLPLSEAGRRAVRPVLEALRDEHRRKRPGFRCAIRGRIHHLLTVLVRDATCGRHLRPALEPTSGEERLAEVLRYCRVNYREHISVGTLANMAHCSRGHFHQLFRQATGTTVTAWLARLRIDEAKRLLRDGDDDILAIAFACGFQSPSRFYTCFRRETGTAPLAYRKSGRRAGPQ